MKSGKTIRTLLAFIFLLNVSVFETFGQNNVDQTIEKNNAAGKTANQDGNGQIENPASQKNNDAAVNESSLKNQQNDRYRIGFQDKLEVNVSRHPELTQTVDVNPDGTIYLPRIDQPILAYCKTEGELKADITTLYKSYLRTPFVSVRVSEQKSQPFAVIGAVEKPGSYYLSRKITLLELLSLAGGPDFEFAGGKIQLARIGNTAGCVEKRNAEVQDDSNNISFVSYSLKDVMQGKQNPMMQPGDIVSVLKSEEAYVVGNIYKPAKVPLNEPVTLTQAIAFAGGLDGTANVEKVIIQRQATANTAKTDLVFNLKDISGKKIPDPLLQANDIVNVGNDKIKSVRNGILKAITGALPNAVYKLP